VNGQETVWAVAFYTRAVRSHKWIEQRSLALHEAVAARLETQPDLIQAARANLRRWMQARPSAALREWQDLLDRAALTEIVALLRSPDETAARLRQSSPFAGFLTAAERQTIFSRYESRRA
jgi:hypothetical protein